jgi:hypothetical protein
VLNCGISDCGLVFIGPAISVEITVGTYFPTMRLDVKLFRLKTDGILPSPQNRDLLRSGHDASFLDTALYAFFGKYLPDIKKKWHGSYCKYY